MILIEYWPSLAAISCLWVLVRALFCIKDKQFNLKRELQLLLVYVCIVVVARFTFFPFGKVEGKIQPLILDVANMWNFRINWLPFVNLLDYGEKRDVLINVIGNTAMFVPLGIVWAVVYKKLNSHAKVISAGIGFSLMIEILQLPFYDRVTDVDDLILNSLGFIIGYGIYLLAKAVKREKRKGK